MCLLVETIRIDEGKFHFIPYHQQRIDRSIGHNRICIANYIQSLMLPPHGCFKLRITYLKEGIIEHTITPYIARTLKTFRLITDNTIQYSCKWDNRMDINRLLEYRNGCDDILILRNGMITDSSFANIALFNGVQWITPNEPLLAGTCRARLLEEGILIPERITLQTLKDYHKIVPINAMIGFNPSQAVIISPQSILL